MISSDNASATCLAGVMRSSPYRIMLWLMSMSSTVAHDDRCSLSYTSKSCSCRVMSSSPPRLTALLMVPSASIWVIGSPAR